MKDHKDQNLLLANKIEGMKNHIKLHDSKIDLKLKEITKNTSNFTSMNKEKLNIMQKKLTDLLDYDYPDTKSELNEIKQTYQKLQVKIADFSQVQRRSSLLRKKNTRMSKSPKKEISNIENVNVGIQELPEAEAIDSPVKRRVSKKQASQDSYPEKEKEKQSRSEATDSLEDTNELLEEELIQRFEPLEQAIRDLQSKTEQLSKQLSDIAQKDTDKEVPKNSSELTNIDLKTLRKWCMELEARVNTSEAEISKNVKRVNKCNDSLNCFKRNIQETQTLQEEIGNIKDQLLKKMRDSKALPDTRKQVTNSVKENIKRFTTKKGHWPSQEGKQITTLKDRSSLSKSVRGTKKIKPASTRNSIERADKTERAVKLSSNVKKLNRMLKNNFGNQMQESSRTMMKTSKEIIKIPNLNSFKPMNQDHTEENDSELSNQKDKNQHRSIHEKSQIRSAMVSHRRSVSINSNLIELERSRVGQKGNKNERFLNLNLDNFINTQPLITEINKGSPRTLVPIQVEYEDIHNISSTKHGEVSMNTKGRKKLPLL